MCHYFIGGCKHGCLHLILIEFILKFLIQIFYPTFCILLYTSPSTIKVGDTVSVWPLECDISISVNTSVPFRVYRKYIYIYMYTFLIPIKLATINK